MLFGESGRINYIDEILTIEELNDEGKKNHIKKLYEEDPVAYLEFKNFCMELNELPDIFGTHDNPIPIDESKL